MIEPAPTFGKLLLSYRRRLDLSQQEAATMVGMYSSDLSKIERDAKKPPSANVILQWIDGLQLSRQEALEFVRAAGYSPSILARTQFDPTAYPILLDSVESRLRGSDGYMPVLEIDSEGKIISANLLAFRLLGALEPHDTDIIPEQLLERNIFEVIIDASNFSRIAMPEKKTDYWFTQLVVYRKLRDRLPRAVVEQFEKVINSHPVLSLLLQHDTTTALEQEWEYILSIYPAELPPFEEPRIHLQFKIRAEQVIKNGKRTGFLISYYPLMPYTIERTKREYQRLIDKFGAEKFIQSIPDTHVLEDNEKFPPFWPAFHFNIYGDITFMNTILLALYGEESSSKLFQQVPWFDAILSSRTTALVHPPIGIERLRIPLQQFHRHLSQLARDPLHASHYIEVRDKLIMLLARLGIDSLTEELFNEQQTQIVEIEHTVPWFPIEMKCPLIDTFSLSFYLYARPLYHLEGDYRVGFVPQNTITRIALILLRMQRDEHFTQSIPQGGTSTANRNLSRNELQRQQLLWLLSIIEVIQMGILKEKGDHGWHPERIVMEQYSQLLSEYTKPLEILKLQFQWELSNLLLEDSLQSQNTLLMLRAFLTFHMERPAFLLHVLPSINVSTDEMA